MKMLCLSDTAQNKNRQLTGTQTHIPNIGIAVNFSSPLFWNILQNHIENTPINHILIDVKAFFTTTMSTVIQELVFRNIEIERVDCCCLK